MVTSLDSSFRCLEQLSVEEADALLDRARSLRRSARQGRVRPLLRSKNLGMLCADQTSEDARFFVRAASGLGARIADIRPSLVLAQPEEALQTVRMLGRLYDAIECQGVPADFVRRARQHAGVPVFEALASPKHPTAHLAALLDPDGATADDARFFILQAALVVALE
jgi:ornithine carbamoyltransferase